MEKLRRKKQEEKGGEEKPGTPELALAVAAVPTADPLR